MRSKFFCATIFLVSALPAGAVELHHLDVRQGTKGLDRVSISITDAAGVPLACYAELAHWYSVIPTRIAPGTTVAMELWRDPASATYSVLNDKRENMTAETLWCGFASAAYETRSQIPLDRSPGTPLPRAVTCSEEDGRLRCR